MAHVVLVGGPDGLRHPRPTVLAGIRSEHETEDRAPWCDQPMTTSIPPEWPHCGHGADPDIDPVGCRGRRVEPFAECLAHLTDVDRTAYLATLSPGADVDHRGTTFAGELLNELFATLADPGTHLSKLGEALFEQAEFDCHVQFYRAEFSGRAGFDGAKFAGKFMSLEVKFDSLASFVGAEFRNAASFAAADFRGNVYFDEALFCSHTIFNLAVFRGSTGFGGAVFLGDVRFYKASFERTVMVGPLVSTGTLDFDAATFGTAVTIEAAAAAVYCWRTRWAATAALRLRYASVHLGYAVMEYPVSIATHSRPFTSDGTAEPGLGDDARARMMSLQGVDAAHLTLADVDLTDCFIAETIHLDQLRLEGRYVLPLTPSGVRWRGGLPTWWTPRRTLIEEHHWRASRSTGADGWTPAPAEVEVLEPVALAPVYRQLRKSFEDSKHEPGAADFYYGEMEMRRHADDIPRSERALLTTYWALSGYGLRAARALGWLAIAMTATILLMMGFGLPNEPPKQEITRERVGGHWKTIIDKPDPKNPTGDRFTGKRFEKALNVTLNSVVFRSSGQDLTTAGIYIEMTSRLTEPVLLGFAGLAVRGRVKRGS